MVDEKHCQGCNQADRCQEVYRRLGKAEGPSVVFKVIVAFLLPIVIFIVSLVVFDKILGVIVSIEWLRTALSILIALFITFGIVLIIKVISKKFNEKV